MVRSIPSRSTWILGQGQLRLLQGHSPPKVRATRSAVEGDATSGSPPDDVTAGIPPDGDVTAAPAAAAAEATSPGEG